MHDIDITIIGGGVMGSAIVAGMLSKQFVSAEHITVCDPSNDQLKVLTRAYNIKTSCNNAENIPHAEWVILAVKPQHMSDVLSEIKPHLKSRHLVISIAAGTKLTTIVDALKHDRVVRVMPNTPAKVGCGMAVWITTEAVTAGDKKLVREFLGTLGDEVELTSDDEIDKATAIHGSGPGYFFYCAESLLHVALELGFSQEIAQKLVTQTLYGSGVLARESGLDPATLKKQVTSKGGGTEAALNTFEDEGVRNRFMRGVQAAYQRYLELSKHS